VEVDGPVRAGREPIGGARAPTVWDVVVVGAGGAGLAGALAAAATGARVLVLDAAAGSEQGGATRHALALALGWRPRSHGALDVALTAGIPYQHAWLARHGVRFQGPPSVAQAPSSTHRFLLGGGLAMLTRLRAAAVASGVVLAPDCQVRAVLGDVADPSGVVVESAGRAERVAARALLFATGGAGAAAGKPALVPRPVDASGLDALEAAGAATAGAPRALVVPVDARAPRYDGGVVVRIAASNASVCCDETGTPLPLGGGEGALAAAIRARPGGRAFAIWDASAPTPRIGLGAVRAAGLGELGAQLGAPPGTLEAAANGRLRAPFVGVSLRAGALALDRGVLVDPLGRVRDRSGRPSGRLFAAGDLVAPALVERGTDGLAPALVLGRVAGSAAAEAARSTR